MCVRGHLCFFLYLLSLWVKRAFKYIYIFYYSLSSSVFGFYIATVAPCGEALSPHTQQLRQVLTFGVKALFSHFISQRNKGQSEARLQQNHCNKQYYPPALGWGVCRK